MQFSNIYFNFSSKYTKYNVLCMHDIYIYIYYIYTYIYIFMKLTLLANVLARSNGVPFVNEKPLD